MKCWGFNRSGQLGDGTQLNSTTPVQVSGLSSGVIAIGAGGDNSCALTASGAVACWGTNLLGQLGNGDESRGISATPVAVVGLESGVTAIMRRHDRELHDCTGVVELSPPASTPEPNPATVQVDGLSTGVRTITVGDLHSCAGTDAGAAKCWGSNTSGQLGNGTSTGSPVPVQVAVLAAGVRALDAGVDHTCALTDGGPLYCWGANSAGQLGNGGRVTSTVPIEVRGLSSAPRVLSTAARASSA